MNIRKQKIEGRQNVQDDGGGAEKCVNGAPHSAGSMSENGTPNSEKGPDDRKHMNAPVIELRPSITSEQRKSPTIQLRFHSIRWLFATKFRVGVAIAIVAAAVILSFFLRDLLSLREFVKTYDLKAQAGDISDIDPTMIYGVSNSRLSFAVDTKQKLELIEKTKKFSIACANGGSNCSPDLLKGLDRGDSELVSHSALNSIDRYDAQSGALPLALAKALVNVRKGGILLSDSLAVHYKTELTERLRKAIKSQALEDDSSKLPVVEAQSSLKGTIVALDEYLKVCKNLYDFDKSEASLRKKMTRISLLLDGLSSSDYAEELQSFGAKVAQMVSDRNSKIEEEKNYKSIHVYNLGSQGFEKIDGVMNTQYEVAFNQYSHAILFVHKFRITTRGWVDVYAVKKIQDRVVITRSGSRQEWPAYLEMEEEARQLRQEISELNREIQGGPTRKVKLANLVKQQRVQSEEILSIIQSLKGWQPSGSASTSDQAEDDAVQESSTSIEGISKCNAPKHTVIVDKFGGKLRYRAWQKPTTPLDAEPSMTIVGGKEVISGSEKCRRKTWYFPTKGHLEFRVAGPGCLNNAGDDQGTLGVYQKGKQIAQWDCAV